MASPSTSPTTPSCCHANTDGSPRRRRRRGFLPLLLHQCGAGRLTPAITSGRLICCEESLTCSELRHAVKLFPWAFISSSIVSRGGGIQSLPWFHLKLLAVIVPPASRTLAMMALLKTNGRAVPGRIISPGESLSNRLPRRPRFSNLSTK